MRNIYSPWQAFDELTKRNYNRNISNVILSTNGGFYYDFF